MTVLLAIVAIVLSVIALKRVGRTERAIVMLNDEMNELRKLMEHAPARAEEAPLPVPEEPPIVVAPVLVPEPVVADVAPPPAETPVPQPVAAYEAAPPPPPPPYSPPRPAPPPPTPVTPKTPAKPFDWENLVGIKLFSWIAGLALVLAAVFLFKYSVEHGWLRPPIRAAIGVMSGVALLIVCELRFARNYRFTANAMDGAGIGILYATLFAMHNRWQLLPPWLAFVLMIVVTAVAVIQSTRRDSVFIALLGLLGGFATPALLSSGENRPIALFSYLLLLNAGMSWVAYRKRWPALTALTVVLTAIYQWSWIAKFLDRGQLPLAASIFVVFAILGASALWTRKGEAPFERTATIGAALPLLFAFFTAIVPEYGARFHVLFGFLFVMALALATIAMWRGPAWLHTLGGGATALTFFIWLVSSYTHASWPWSLAWLAAFVVLYLAVAWRMHTIAVHTAGILFFVLVGLAFREPQGWALQVGIMFALLALVAGFAGRTVHIPLLAVPIVISTILLCALNDAPPSVRLASALGLAAIAVAVMAWRPAFRNVAMVSLFLGQIVAMFTTTDATLIPLLATNAVLLLGIFGVAWVSENYAAALIAVPVTAAATAFACTDYGPIETVTQQFWFAFVFYALFIAWPLALGARVKQSLMPHLTAMFGSLVFFLFAYDALKKLGYEDVIGLLPLAQAAVMLVVLWRLLRLRPAVEGPREQLTRLAMVAGTVLAFITTAVPLQLDKEWITIAWALEGLALAWLFTRIPHKGLLAWSGGLFVAVFVRLVLNPAVLDYHAKSATPVVNWYLYTYLVCAAAMFLALRFIPEDEKVLRVPLSAGGTFLLFVLLNIEIADYYSTGDTLTFNFMSSSLAQDLTYTMGWALFAIAMLVAGIALAKKAARVAALVLLLVTVLKCFLHDLARLGGLYRVASLFGLAVSLVLVGILLQKFVMMRREPEASLETPAP